MGYRRILAPCRHCGRTLGVVGRGLCQRCHRTPGVRDQYASASKFGQRVETPVAKTLPAPTLALPGAPEKMAVMRDRIAAGELVHHPDDARAA